jgi:hypothetical protein
MFCLVSGRNFNKLKAQNLFMKAHFYLPALILLITFACNSPKTGENEKSDSAVVSIPENTPLDSAVSVPKPSGFDQHNPISYLQLENYLAIGKVNGDDVLRIDSAYAVFVFPTEEQTKEMEKEYGEDGFYTIADDLQYYQSEAMNLLDSAGIKNKLSNRKYLHFVSGENIWLLDVKKKGAPEWNLVLFNPGKAPEVVSAIDLNWDKIKSYYGVK